MISRDYTAHIKRLFVSAVRFAQMKKGCFLDVNSSQRRLILARAVSCTGFLEHFSSPMLLLVAVKT